MPSRLATDARRFGDCLGFAAELVRDALGVLAGVFGAIRRLRSRS
jgi:hypothetical protein